MANRKILIAEDDTNIRNGLVDTLESEGYRVSAATDGKEAVDIFRKRRPDLVILDVMMPQLSGYDVCRAIRAEDEHVPIIMLTAKGEEIDKVVGLQLGADDYVTKPFGIHELLARIAAQFRRSTTAPDSPDGTRDAPDTFTFGAATIDCRRYRARRGRKAFELSDREVQLLRFFYARPDEVLSRDELLNAVWGINYYGTTRTLDQHIAQLRKKIESGKGKAETIVTVHGVGYRYVPAGEPNSRSRAR